MFNKLPIWIIAIVVTLALSLTGIAAYKTYGWLTKNPHIISVKHEISLVDRCGSTLPYWLPLLEGLQNFGQYVLPEYPFGIMSTYRKTLMPLVIFYVTHPALALVTFFILYYLFVRTKSPIPDRPFIRFNVLQSILLFLINSLLGATYRALPIEFRASLYGSMICNTLFWFALLTVAYSVIKSIEGKYAKIPVISQAVRMQIDNPY